MGTRSLDQWTTCPSVRFRYWLFSRHSQRLPEKGSLQAAFTTLGLDRVVAGARALYLGDRGWSTCFLAMAYGEVGEPEHLVPDECLNFEEAVSRILEIDVETTKTVTGHFDSDRAHFTSELVQWLESRGVNAATVLVETRREINAKPCECESL